MTRPSIIAAAVRKGYPSAIKESDGTPFRRPAWTDDGREYSQGFYWENGDTPPDRFYFDTFEEAAEDWALSAGLDEAEALDILAGHVAA